MWGPYLALDSSSEAFIGRRPPSNTITGTTPQPRSRRIRSMQNATYLPPAALLQVQHDGYIHIPVTAKPTRRHNSHIAQEAHLSVGAPSHSCLLHEYAPLWSHPYASIATRRPEYIETCTVVVMLFSIGSRPWMPMAAGEHSYR